MRQLDLFGNAVASVASTPAPVAPAEVVPAAPPPTDVLPGQVGLFEDRTLRWGRARVAIGAGRLAEACRELGELGARYPEDALATSEAERAEGIRKKLTKIDSPRTRARVKALLGLAREIVDDAEPWCSLRRVLLGRVAEEIRRAQGDDGALEGQPAGYYLIEAGALAEAREALTAAIAVRRSARALFLLADVTLALGGEQRAARRLYLEALLVDPFDPARASVRDQEVRLLADVARDDLEIEEEPVAWAAVAGLLTDVLQHPKRREEPLAPPPPPDASLPPAQREALGQARAFVAAFARRNGDQVEARREMKRIAPRAFAFYMARLEESWGGRR
jgi:tetratricopeptide (TPR) repeat protein